MNLKIRCIVDCCLERIIYVYASVFLLLTLPSLVLADPIPKIQVLTGGYEAILAKRRGTDVQGPRTDAVKAFMLRTKLDYDVVSLLWGRAYQRVLNEPMTLVYPLTRTKDREDQFDWIHRIDEHEYHLIGHISLKNKRLTKDQIISGDYFAICEKTASTCGMAEEFGFPENAIIRTMGKEVKDIVELVMRGRASFMLENITTVRGQVGLELFSSVARVGNYNFKRQEYLAGYKTDKRLLDRLANVQKD